MQVDCTRQYQAAPRVNHPLRAARADARRRQRGDLSRADAHVGRPASAAGYNLATFDKHVVILCHGFTSLFPAEYTLPPGAPQFDTTCLRCSNGSQLAWEKRVPVC